MIANGLDVRLKIFKESFHDTMGSSTEEATIATIDALLAAGLDVNYQVRYMQARGVVCGSAIS